MKKHILRIVALLIFVSAISSCSVEYRESHGRHDRDNRDRDHHERNYNNGYNG